MLFYFHSLEQMIRKCKEQIMETGKLWDQDKPLLIGNMKVRG